MTSHKLTRTKMCLVGIYTLLNIKRNPTKFFMDKIVKVLNSTKYIIFNKMYDTYTRCLQKKEKFFFIKLVDCFVDL